MIVQAEPTRQPHIARLQSARYREQIGGVQITAHLDLTLSAGDLVFVQVDRSRLLTLLGDACCGLVLPVLGESQFIGRAWASQPPEDAAAMRARIGRAGPDSSWVPLMSVAENVVLAQMHHTRRPIDELLEQARELADAMELPGLPLGLPSEVGHTDLNRAGIVRAFMGQPRLIVLERPAAGDSALVPLLLDRVLSALDRGAAVLWVDEKLPEPFGVVADSRRFRLRRSGQLEPLR
ncbi:MAG: organic solvent ABC transporter ATP-binding protein [Planctomycetota bacterium]